MKTEYDDEIAARLDRGDIEGACMLAAKVADPRGHLAAMRIVSEYMNKAKGRPRMIELKEQDAILSKYNPRPELHGQDPTSAADVRVTFNAASAAILPMLDPELRGFLFHKHGTKQHDLADVTADAPDLRFPKLQAGNGKAGGKYEWALALDGASLTIHRGIGGKSDIVLPGKVRKPIVISPQQGGTVIVSLQVQCHPDAEQAGALYTLMSQKITVSFAPGTEGEPELPGVGEGEGGEGDGEE